MILLIGGASHTGKTLLARRLVERTGFSCLSLDLLKMGLIRSGFTALTPEDDEALTGLLWPIAREMIRTALENGQDLIVEGVYIPPAWRDGFRPEELAQIRCRFLVMTEDYIRHHFADTGVGPAWWRSAWTTADAPWRVCWRTTGAAWRGAIAVTCC